MNCSAKPRVAAPPSSSGLSEWERKVARSIVRKEARRREENGPAALLILPSDVCRQYLTGECADARACGLAHRVPAEFTAFVAKAKRQSDDAAASPTASDASIRSPPASAPTTPPITGVKGGSPAPPPSCATPLCVWVGSGSPLLDADALQQCMAGSANVASGAKEVSGTAIDVCVTSVAGKKGCAALLRSLVAAASSDEPTVAALVTLGVNLSARAAVMVRGVVVALDRALADVVLAALPMSGADKDAVARLVGSSTSASFDSVALVLQRAIEVASGIKRSRCVLIGAPRTVPEHDPCAGRECHDTDSFLALWCDTRLAPDPSDSESSRAARAVAGTIRRLEL